MPPVADVLAKVVTGTAWGAVVGVSARAVLALVFCACGTAATADDVRESIESSVRLRTTWLDVELPAGTTGDVVTLPDWREVYRRFAGDFFFKAEGALIIEEHGRNAALDLGIVRGEFQAGLHAYGLYWLAEWRPRYAGRDGFEDTFTRQNQYGIRARTNVLPEPPEGVDFDIQPNIGVGFIDAWPDALDRWDADAEIEFVTRLNARVNLTVAPKIEWLHYPEFAGGTRDDVIESLRVATRLRVAPGWAFTIEAQITQTESSVAGADTLAVSVMPLIRNVVRF